MECVAQRPSVYTTPITGLMTRRGISTADPMAVLGCITVFFNAVFVTGIFGWLVPGFGKWIRDKRDRIWPPAKQPDLGPSWVCAHCHEENPGNFDECWKCQRSRPGEQSLDD
jgi:hypothetical protein